MTRRPCPDSKAGDNIARLGDPAIAVLPGFLCSVNGRSAMSGFTRGIHFVFSCAAGLNSEAGVNLDRCGTGRSRSEFQLDLARVAPAREAARQTLRRAQPLQLASIHGTGTSGSGATLTRLRAGARTAFRLRS